jgi:integrase
MSGSQLLDAAGRRRSPATVPGFHAGRPPRNKGFRYPPDPPRVEEIIAVMRQAGEADHGLRLRALIVVLWRAGLRIGEAMALTEPDLDPARGSLLVRQGKGGKRREVGMDAWGFEQLRPWLARRVEMPVGTLFCVIDGQTRGRPWTRPPPATTCAASQRGRESGDVSRHTSFATPMPLRWPASGCPLNVIQRQLGHVNLGVTSVYLDGIDTAEITETVHARRPPMISASAGVRI